MQREIKGFEIKFAGLKEGEHNFQYKLDQAFFEEFLYTDYADAHFDAQVKLIKKAHSLELQASIEGQALVQCDVTLDYFWMPLSTKGRLDIKFGQSFDDTNDEVLWLPETEHLFNVAQYLYELAALVKPLKTVDPDVRAGKKGKEALRRLEELSPENQNSPQKEQEIDPRWDKLRELLN